MGESAQHQRLLRVCYVLAYRAPDYVRSRSLLAALERTGGIELVRATNRSPSLARYWQALRALLRARKHEHPDIYILGFRGIEIAWLVRWLTRGRPLVVDALMSPYAALHEEGKHGRVGRWLARLWYPFEAAGLRHADAVLTDTHLHAAYYTRTFGIPPDRLLPLPVGADESHLETESPSADVPGQPFRVLFYGSLLPLHGMDIIVGAAARLDDLPVQFHFIGGTRRQGKQFQANCSAAGVRRYVHRRWVDFDRLLDEEIPNADLCLGGPFGGTPQARRVVTGKTSQFLASGKATVVGRIDEDLGFADRHNCLLVDQGDVQALADAIRWAFEHRGRLKAIGLQGRALYRDHLSVREAGDRLTPLLQRLAATLALA